MPLDVRKGFAFPVEARSFWAMPQGEAQPRQQLSSDAVGKA